MDCRLIQGELFPYVFGTSSAGEREELDAHLLDCQECLRAYLRLKHHVEGGASLDARPSGRIRRLVRDDVAALVRPRAVARVRRWLRRPIPLYQGLAVAAIAAGITLAGPWLRDATARRPPQIEARIDTSREVPRSLSVY